MNLQARRRGAAAFMDTLSIIFAKEPLAGQVKTRLTPPFSFQETCRLYQAFLEDVLDTASRLRAMAWTLAYAPAGARKYFRRLAPGVSLFPQEGRDLGERMARAFDRGFAAGHQNVLIRGADTPDLPGAILLEAREELASGRAQVVLGPSLDGGYYLVGLKAPEPALFAGLPWSTEAVLGETLNRARELSLKVHLLASWSDIDTYADLLAFLKRRHRPPRPGWRSDRTARQLLAGMGRSVLAKL